MIIGLTGKKGSGKDTIANYLVSKYGFIKLSFGGAVKDIVHIITGWDRELIEGSTEESRIFRETIKHKIYNKTCRELMQIIGTDLFRNHFDENIWINIIINKIDINKSYVITDVRFDNEALSIKNLGSGNNSEQDTVLVKITRTDTDSSSDLHISETGITVGIDFEILNDGISDNYMKEIDKLFHLAK
jgi:hypothetical protein